MSNQMTTTQNGFRVEDVTYKRARRQSEIDNEIDRPEEKDEGDIKPPVSLTPEQVKAFYLSKIALATDTNEKRVYAQTIRWIDDLLDTKKKLIALELKEVTEADGSTDDID